MARFIQMFDESYISVDMIGLLVHKLPEEKGGLDYYEVYDKEHRLLGRVNKLGFDPYNIELREETVIKADTGFSLALPSINFDTHKIEIILHPIIAWSIFKNGTVSEVAPICIVPVFIRLYGEAILFPNGEVRGDGGEWKNLNAYREHVEHVELERERERDIARYDDENE